MSQVKNNIIYKCKKCNSKGTLAKNVSSYNFAKIDKLPCGCSAENGKFQFLHPL